MLIWFYILLVLEIRLLSLVSSRMRSIVISSFYICQMQVRLFFFFFICHYFFLHKRKPWVAVARTVSCHLAGVRFAWFGLCLRSRDDALLCCVWDGVRCLLDCVLYRGTVSGSLGSIVDLRLWVVVYTVISLAFHQLVFPGIRVS